MALLTWAGRGGSASAVAGWSWNVWREACRSGPMESNWSGDINTNP